MGSFKEIFTEYGGDYKGTMLRFMDNEAMYIKILAMLEKDDSVEKLDRALKDNDLTAAYEAAHTLKGVAGNLGLTPLYDAACEIVEPLRARESREDYPNLYEDTRAEYDRAIALLKELNQAVS